MEKKINILNIFLDYFLLIFTLFSALWLRFNGEIPKEYLNIFFYSGWFIALGKIIIFYFFKIYKTIIKYIHTYDVINILKANLISTIIFTLFNYFFKTEKFFYPRSVLIIDFILSVSFIIGIRFLEKFFFKSSKTIQFKKKKKVLIAGTGEGGNIVLREIRNHPESGLKVIGFVDDNKDKINMSIGGKKVLGKTSDIPSIVKKYNIDLIVIAMPSAGKEVINRIVEICEDTEAKLKIVPSTYEIITGDVKFEQIRDIKLEDLLGREEIVFKDTNVEKYIKNKIVLITGAGGSIGSEISRQTALFSPKKLILMGKGENSIFNITFELEEKYKHIEIYPVIADINDKNKVEKVFKTFKPQIVFHAAAHKHVYLMELHPEQAFKNNVLGTLTLSQLALKYNVKKFIFISTDKAVNPTSVMGMTKRIAEKIVIGLMQKYNKTKFLGVRFGNVLGSRGSVVPIFKKQIEKGGPVTVTHPEVKRYFMTIPEAVQLVLQSASISTGGEIFILDMGKPIKIVDLAKKMIKLSGYMPNKDIKIIFTGLKTGEKMFEELNMEKEKLTKTKYEKILITKTEKIKFNSLLKKIKEIEKNLYKYSPEKLKKILKQLV